MIRIVPWAFCALACALPLRAEDAPVSEVSKVDYYLREFESRVKFSDGMLYELSKDDTRALEEVKKIAQKYPEDKKVKELVDRGKTVFKLTKGLHVEMTEEILAYRKREGQLGGAASKSAKDAWSVLEKDLAADKKVVAVAFPAPDPLKVDEAEMQDKRVVLKGIKYEEALFVQTGNNWVATGSTAQGRYWINAGGPSFAKLWEAMGRYRTTVKAELPKEWTFVGRVLGAHLLSPTPSACELGWEVEPIAIMIPDTTLISLDAAHKSGASYAGEAEVTRSASASFTVTKIPDDVTPEQLIRTYVTALKEKNWDLHLDCHAPENRSLSQQVDTLRYYWEVQQKGLVTLHAHAEPAEVQEIRAVSGGGGGESIDDFFGDEGDKKEKKPGVALVEHVTVKVRLFGENGYQSAKPRFVTLTRTNKGRWYIWSGGTLTF